MHAVVLRNGRKQYDEALSMCMKARASSVVEYWSFSLQR
jgi:hypothetical protein